MLNRSVFFRRERGCLHLPSSLPFHSFVCSLNGEPVSPLLSCWWIIRRKEYLPSSQNFYFLPPGLIKFWIEFITILYPLISKLSFIYIYIYRFEGKSFSRELLFIVGYCLLTVKVVLATITRNAVFSLRVKKYSYKENNALKCTSYFKVVRIIEWSNFYLKIEKFNFSPFLGHPLKVGVTDFFFFFFGWRGVRCGATMHKFIPRRSRCFTLLPISD